MMTMMTEKREFKNSTGRIEVVTIVENTRDAIREQFLENADSTKGLHYSIAVKSPTDPDKAEIYYRPNNPCLGDLATYKGVHGGKGEYNPSRPSDLYWDFPTGEILAIVVSYKGYPLLFDDFTRLAIDHFGIKDVELVKIEAKFPEKDGRNVEGLETGFPIFWDMDIHPNRIFSFLYYTRYKISPFFLKDHPELSDDEFFAYCVRGLLFEPDKRRYINKNTIGIKGILSRNFREFPGGTYREGYGYVRFQNELPWETSSEKNTYGFDHPWISKEYSTPLIQTGKSREEYYKIIKEIINDFNQSFVKEEANV